MVITKEQQGELIEKYFLNHTWQQTECFIAGMEATVKLVDKILKEEKEVPVNDLKIKQ